MFFWLKTYFHNIGFYQIMQILPKSYEKFLADNDFIHQAMNEAFEFLTIKNSSFNFDHKGIVGKIFVGRQ